MTASAPSIRAFRAFGPLPNPISATLPATAFPLKSRNSPRPPSISAPATPPSGSDGVRTWLGHIPNSGIVSPVPSTVSAAPRSTGTVTGNDSAVTRSRPISRNCASTQRPASAHPGVPATRERSDDSRVIVARMRPSGMPSMI